MTIKQRLDEIRDANAKILAGHGYTKDDLKDGYISGFDAATAELLPLLEKCREALEIYADKYNWYERTDDTCIKFHDGSDQNLGMDTAKEALAELDSFGKG